MKYSLRYGRVRALLRRIREEAALSQATLAKKLGKPQTFVSKSELGERRMDLLETLDFCAACNVSITQFMKRLHHAGAAKAKPKRKSPRKMDAKGRVVNR